MARRLILLTAIVVAVLGLHAWVGRTIGRHLHELRAEGAMPPLLTVTYVRELTPSAPPIPPPGPPKAVARKPYLAPGTTVVAAAAATASSPVPPEPPAADERPPPATSPPDEAVGEPEPSARAALAAWPGSTRLTYVLGGQFRGELHGKAQVEWIRSGDRYQVLMEVRSGLLFERQMRSEGRITPQGLQPQRYDQLSQRLFQEQRRLSMGFEPGVVVLANGQRVPALAGVQDSASQFVQLTHLFRSHPEMLRAGNEVDIPLALPRHVSHWVYEVGQREVIDTPMGALETFSLKPRRPGVNVHNDLKAEMWFAPSLQYLPVRIRIVQDEDSYLDLLIAKNPELGTAE